MTKKRVDILLYIISFLLSSKATILHSLGPVDVQPKALIKQIFIKTKVNQKQETFSISKKST
jgi:hypothetical protein